MRTLGFVACLGSVALIACGGSDNGPGTTMLGIGGVPAAVGAGGTTAVTAPPTTTGTQGQVPPAGSVGAPPATGAAPGVLPPGAGGSVVTAPPAAGGTTSTTGVGGTPSGGAPNGGAANGGAGGAVGTPDPPGTVTIPTLTFQLMPGQEAYRCQNFDNPFGGKDTAVNRIVTDMTKGSHHLHVYNLTEGTGRGLEVCTSSDFHALVHSAGSPHAETDYPDGMATRIIGANGLRIQLHYINTTSDVITGGATLKMTPVADISTISKWVAELYFNRLNLTVSLGKSSVTTNCIVPNNYGPITLIWGGTHMHKRGIGETAMSSTGAMLANATTWDEPPAETYSPPVTLNPGDSISWTCTYQNDTGMQLHFGESADTNEMCIYLARYYTTNKNDTQIECQAQGDNGGTAFLMPN